MPSRTLGPTGRAEPGPPLSGTTLEHLREILLSHGHRGPEIDGFLRELDVAARIHPGWVALQGEARPATVRKELRAVRTALARLIERLNGLGGVSRQILHLEARGDGNPAIGEAIDRMAGQVLAAVAIAEALDRTGGRPRGYADLHLAIQVRHAMQSCLGVEPTITRGGLFEDILKTLLEALGPGRDDPSVRDLMRAALRAEITVGDGVVEIDPGVG